MTSSSEEEKVAKESIHANLFPNSSKSFTQVEKDRIERLVRNDILDIVNARTKHEIILTTNKDKRKLDDEQKQAERDRFIHQHIMVMEMFDRELEILENILKKLE